jgi:hypothetical protein
MNSHTGRGRAAGGVRAAAVAEVAGGAAVAGGVRRGGRLLAAAPVTLLALLGAAVGAAPALADAATGFAIVGPLDVGISTKAGLTLDVAAVVNNSAKAQQLGLQLWAIPMSDGLPTYSALQDFTFLGGVNLGSLGAGKSITDIAYSGLGYTPPKAGCYYLTLALLGSSLQTLDLFILNKGGTPTANGYNLFAFGGATCPAATSCSISANAGCLLSSRFLVTATYYNATDGKSLADVLSFGGQRAESDESVFYYFTDPSNFEMGVKILDACTINNYFWVFIGGLTNQGWEVNILDTANGHTQYYNNPLNTTTVTTTDTTALPCP